MRSGQVCKSIPRSNITHEILFYFSFKLVLSLNINIFTAPMAKKPKTSGDYYGQECRLQSYHKPKYSKLIIAYSYNNQDSRSATITFAVEKLFNEMPESEIKKLFAIYEKMTDEEKRNPGKR